MSTQIKDKVEKSIASKDDDFLLQQQDGATFKTSKEGLIALENGNWGHSGAAIAGASGSPLLPYAILADTAYNMTTDKEGLLMEYPNLDPNFKFDVATQRFYTDSNVSGQAKYLVRAILKIDVSPPKTGETVFVMLDKYSSSVAGDITDPSILIVESSTAIPKQADAEIETLLNFYSDSDTATHGIGLRFQSSIAATIKKHSIYIARIG